MRSSVVLFAILGVTLFGAWSCSSDTQTPSNPPVETPNADASDGALDSARDASTTTDGALDSALDHAQPTQDTGPEADAPSEAGPASPDDVTVQWTACSLYDGADDGRAECAEVQMPLFWWAHDGRTFTVTAKRLVATGQGTKQLWLLHGGPGASGVIGFPSWMEELHEDDPALDVYTLDPRGTGYSGFAECPEQESETSDGAQEITPSEVPACAAHLQSQWGDALATMGTTSAAYDLGAFIHHTRDTQKKVLVWGGSGGTFWAQRFLQLYPQGADGVVLEGIEPADGSLALMDEAAISVGREILDRCRADQVCGQKLPDPETTLTALYAGLDSTHCQIGLDSATLRAVIDYLEYYGPYHGLIPSLIYRLDRCNNQDVQALIVFFDVLFGGGQETHSFSNVLFWNETTSELWEHSRFADNAALISYLDGVYEDKLLGTRKGYMRNEVYLAWPRYHDWLDDTWAQTDVPILMLQGLLDPATPHLHAATLAGHFTGQRQVFLSFPNAAHNVMGATPIAEDPAHTDCGRSLFQAFLQDPEALLDTSCVNHTMGIDFTGEQGLAAYFYGTADYFENEAAKLPPSQRMLRGRLAVDLRSLSLGLRRALGGRSLGRSTRP